MQRFEEWAAENGVKFPKTPIGEIFFERKWDSIRAEYYTLHREFRNNSKAWEDQVKELEENWQTKIDTTYSELVGDVKPFKTMEEAKTSLREFKLPSVYDLSRDVRNHLRKEWVKKVIGAAGKECKLIVIKTPYPQCEQSAEFEKAIKERREATFAVYFSIFGIAFKPDKKVEELNTEKWAISKKYGTVEYYY